MAKKPKKSILDSVMSPTEATVGDSSQAVVDNTSALATEKIEVSEQVKYDDTLDIKDELSRVVSENSELKDKLAEYIDQIDNINEQYKKIKDDYDSSIVKISELSFENATLKARIEELEKSNNLNVNSNNNLKPLKIKQSTSVPYMHTTNCNNGYSDWN